MPILGSLASGSTKSFGFGSFLELTTDFYQIATTTVGAGTTSQIVFSSIPADYTHLQIRAISRANAAIGDDLLRFQFNSDTGNNYSYHALSGNGSATSASNATSTSFLITQQSPGNNRTSNTYGAYVVDILDYKDTNKFKTIRSIGGFDSNGAGELGLTSGNWRNTNAITSIKLYIGIYNLSQYSSFQLYGVKA